MKKPKKILMLNFGGIGDEILFLPAISSLKKEYPDAKITLALEPRSKSVKDLTNLIDDVMCVDIKGKHKYLALLKFAAKARLGKYDMVFSSGANQLIPLLLFSTGITYRYGYESGLLSRVLLTKAVKLKKNQYASFMYHELVTPVTDIKTDYPEIDAGDVEKEPNSVLIHPGVSKMSVVKNMVKTWSPEIWAELIKKILESGKGKKVYLIGGPDDKECIEKIVEILDKNLGEMPNFENLYGTTKNIMDLARLTKRAETLICSDSAPMHIGVGVGTRTLALFGPTDEKKLIPSNNEKYIAIKNKCGCRPCLWDKRQTTCEELECLKIDLDEVVKLI